MVNKQLKRPMLGLLSAACHCRGLGVAAGLAPLLSSLLSGPPNIRPQKPFFFFSISCWVWTAGKGVATGSAGLLETVFPTVLDAGGVGVGLGSMPKILCTKLPWAVCSHVWVGWVPSIKAVV